MTIKFWGVRGSTPTPNAENLGYGGNTTCIEIIAKHGGRLIIDAGTGIRALGRELIASGRRDVDILLTHFHWDHIHGLPFFAPLLQVGHKVHFHSFPPADEICRRLDRQMTSPYFTLDFDAVGAQRKYSQVQSRFQLGDFSVTPFELNHPQRATGYRIESQGASVVIATDLEHGHPELDRTLRQNAQGADVLIYDAQYTPAEYQTREGWGHSTYVEACRVAKEAKVGKLILFHHDPTHDDAQMDEIVLRAQELFENTGAAREQEVVTV